MTRQRRSTIELKGAYPYVESAGRIGLKIYYRIESSRAISIAMSVTISKIYYRIERWLVLSTSAKACQAKIYYRIERI